MGNSFFTKGYVTGKDIFGNIYIKEPDYCRANNSSRLIEYSCQFNYVNKTEYNCQWGCKDGACLRQTNQSYQCTDSDGGNNIYTKGVCTDAYGSNVADYCDQEAGGTKVGGLEEVNCQYVPQGKGDASLQGKTSCIYTSLTCPNGCSKGACIPGPTITTCYDSDGGDADQKYIKGYVISNQNSDNFTDECNLKVWNGQDYQYNSIDDNSCTGSDCYVTEGMCIGSGKPGESIWPGVIPTFCENGCKNGACIRPSNTVVSLKDYPSFMFSNGNFSGLIIIGKNAPADDVLYGAGIASSLLYGNTTVNINPFAVGIAKLDSNLTLDDWANKVLIIIGNACVNSATGLLMNNPVDCQQGLVDGVGRIDFVITKLGQPVIVVQGYSDADMKTAAYVLENYKSYDLASAAKDTNDVCVKKDTTGTLTVGACDGNKLLPDRTVFPAPLPNVDNAVVSTADNSITVPFRNNAGYDIYLTLGGTVSPQQGTTCTLSKITGTYNNAPIVSYTTIIPNSANFSLTWHCNALNPAPTVGTQFIADLTFDYIINDAQLTKKTESGSVSMKYSTPVQTGCTDSDGGMNIYTAGEAKNYPYGLSDSCDFLSGKNVLNEAICGQDGIPKYQNVTCPANTPYCNMAVCSNTPPKCTDTDGGIYPNVKGSVTESHLKDPQPHTDYCEDITTLLPAYDSSTNACAAGSSCGVREFYCNGLNLGFKDLLCSNGCSNGACLQSTNISNATCTDSDGGINYYVFGTATDNTKSYSDYCSSQNGLNEAFCDPVYGANIASAYNCPYGCSNGACKLGSTNVSLCVPGRLYLDCNVCNAAGTAYVPTTSKCPSGTTCNNTGRCKSLQPTNPYCGNGIIDAGETCDGSNLGFGPTIQTGYLFVNSSIWVGNLNNGHIFNVLALTQYTAVVSLDGETNVLYTGQTRTLNGAQVNLTGIYNQTTIYGVKLMAAFNIRLPISCSDVGYNAGSLSCSKACLYDTSQCMMKNTNAIN